MPRQAFGSWVLLQYLWLGLGLLLARALYSSDQGLDDQPLSLPWTAGAGSLWRFLGRDRHEVASALANRASLLEKQVGRDRRFFKLSHALLVV